MQVGSPSQQVKAKKGTLYSLVVSVNSTPPIYEVYINAHLHYTALKVNSQCSSSSLVKCDAFTLTDFEIAT